MKKKRKMYVQTKKGTDKKRMDIQMEKNERIFRQETGQTFRQAVKNGHTESKRNQHSDRCEYRQKKTD
jgi:hypothetical protein